MKSVTKYTKEEVASFMEGHDPEERIVNMEYGYNDDFIKVYYRNEKDERCESHRPFYPFLWATEDACKRMKEYVHDKKIAGGNLRTLMQEYGINVKLLKTSNLEGEEIDAMKNGYKFMFFAEQPMSNKKFQEFFKKAGNPVYSNKKDENTTTSVKSKRQYMVVTPVEQYLISTGKRFFKGYGDYDEVLRMIFDLEAEGLDTKKDRINQFGIRFNRPVKYKGEYIDFEKVYEVEGDTKEERDRSEYLNIRRFLSIIMTFQPDIITAHNGENFDWNLIIDALKRLGYDIGDISKEYFDGQPLYKSAKETILKLGGEIEKFYPTIVPRTIVTDSLHAVRRAQAIDSNMLRADLKYATKYAKMVKPNRVYVKGDMIDTIWKDERMVYAFNDEDGDWYETSDSRPLKDGYTLVSGHYIVLRYLLDDLWECDKVELKYNTTNFLICKILPVPFGKCCTMGTAGQWKALLMAWSYENGLAIPMAEDSGKFTGGLSRLLCTGFVKDVIKLDYNSLYPSIILTWGIEDEKDLSHAMLNFLEYVLTTREQSKALKKKAGKIVDMYEERLNRGEKLTKKELREYEKAQADYAFNDKKQSQQKVLGNSFFGAYGSNVGSVFPWKSVECAERTTCTGRQSLRLMISHFNKLGYKPIVGDTDGFNFKLPSSYRYTEENPYISTGKSRETEKGKAYTGYKADVAEFNDMFMCDMHYAPNAVNKMGLGIDEIVESTINFSRKNYADYFPEKPYPEDVKLVGNTVKSKKMPEYIAKFLDKGIRLLLQGNGQGFLDVYYDYIGKIYNYQIPLKQIATKGKVKKYVDEYKKDCQTITKAGRPKSRQAWMELAIKEGLHVDLGETLYYINTGKSKSQADVKKVKHYYTINSGLFGEEKIDCKATLEKEWKNWKKNLKAGEKELPFADYVEEKHKEVVVEDEIILNCKLLPRDIVESEDDILCPEGEEYNVPKYIDMFNNRIKPLLVCFSKDIRGKILIDNPLERPVFTAEDAVLVSGEPNKQGDQDTYEQLMTMEDKEIRFWMRHPEWEIPFLKECGMDWEEIKRDYEERMEREKQLGIDKVRDEFFKCIEELTGEDIENFYDGVLPSSLAKIVEIDPLTNNFVSKEHPDIVIGTIYDILEKNGDKFTEVAISEVEQ